MQFYAACITVALQHLHGLGIAYRDLKTENVLLSCGVVTHHAGSHAHAHHMGLFTTWPCPPHTHAHAHHMHMLTTCTCTSCTCTRTRAGWPVLSDFGLANFVKAGNLTTFCGTPAFMAPEVAAATGYGTAADW